MLLPTNGRSLELCIPFPKLTNKEQASISWKPGPLAPNVTTAKETISREVITFSDGTVSSANSFIILCVCSVCNVALNVTNRV